ncbi:ABC transporter ATP-binding protein [Nocardia aurantia]|uniref:Putative ABC transporter ATP-binding protein n=1 Tax=Nocardia aurantia TaxID=2585199 RepID=A0A7K0DLH3_9NOCA|nr:ABC transporter ATP-binding protein [Nocardia aurantia]MQY26142.1 putative ABC transporter ATP-binding protein [Nocardia aurantia]
METTFAPTRPNLIRRQAVLTVHDLAVRAPDGTAIVLPLDLELAPGEILGLVGESGSGKSTLGMALLGYAMPGLTITEGTVVVAGHDVSSADEAGRRRLRGGVISYVPQDPGAALNPVRRIGRQIDRMLRTHAPELSGAQRSRRIGELLDRVGLPDTREFLRRYPHQLSGGQAQRFAIAVAFSCDPAVVVLDEPTTGLDVVTQRRVLELVRGLCRDDATAAVYISHDLEVVAELADRIAVMYSGRIIESGAADRIAYAAGHPYTRGLIAAVPDRTGRESVTGIPGHAPSPFRRPDGCAFAPRCPVARASCAHGEAPALRRIGTGHLVACPYEREKTSGSTARPAPRGPVAATESAGLTITNLRAGYGGLQVLHGIDLRLPPGRCLAIVGESGSGKTTVAKVLAGLHIHYTGAVELDGATMATAVERRSPAHRRAVQYIFQNPAAALNPRRTVFDTVAAARRVLVPEDPDPGSAVRATLESVALPETYWCRYPHQLSGGERQRVAIARGLVGEPRFLICDEVTSALDVSVQATIVELLRDLVLRRGVGMVFITHQLPLVRGLADEVAVFQQGRLREYAPTGTVLDAPTHDYTRTLLSAGPHPLRSARPNPAGAGTIPLGKDVP